MDSNLSVSISLDDQMPPASAFDVDGQPDFTAPPNAAINVRIVPNPDGRHVFVYDVPDGGFALQLPGPAEAWHVAFWATRSGAGYARVGSASKALEDALANHSDRVLVLHVTRALLSRRAEYVWRDLDTPERIAADHATAYAENLRRDGRCEACEEPVERSGHAAGCPFHPEVIEAAARRVAGLRAADLSDADVDAYAEQLAARR